MEETTQYEVREAEENIKDSDSSNGDNLSDFDRSSTEYRHGHLDAD